MAINFPTSLDTLTNVVDGVDYPKAADINDLNDAVEALEAKVGIDDSAVSTSIDYIIKNNIWPIGSVYFSVIADNPATTIGFGTWEQIAEGKMIVGQSSGDASFDTAEETGGAKTINIAHTHTGPSHVHTGPSHTHYVSGYSDYFNLTTDEAEDGSGETVSSNDYANHRHGVNITSQASGTGNTGAGGTEATGSSLSAAQSIMNPYLVAYIWKRTA